MLFSIASRPQEEILSPNKTKYLKLFYFFVVSHFRELALLQQRKLYQTQKLLFCYYCQIESFKTKDTIAREGNLSGNIKKHEIAQTGNKHVKLENTYSHATIFK